MNEILEIETGNEGAHPIVCDAPRTVEFNKLRKRLIRMTREAIEKFGMVRAGDKSMAVGLAHSVMLNK